MTFDPTIAAIRFGTGLSPRIAPPRGVDEMAYRLAGPDVTAARFPWFTFDEITPSPLQMAEAQRARRGLDPDSAEGKAAAEAYGALREAAAERHRRSLAVLLARGIAAEEGLRERLVRFWSDHFTVEARQTRTAHLVSAYVEGAIRPHVAGRFADMLKAVIRSPVMLVYLDQVRSVGPNSRLGKRRGQGLNENLARELLELHTLGVGGAYGQADVTELAELLTGLTWNPDRGFRFEPALAEPGAETVLGRRYGGPGEARLADIDAALEDIARHPDTARHLARKLAVHFVADEPDPALVAAMAAAYADSDGDLHATTLAMLRHPAAWGPPPSKAKTPMGFIQTALRALDMDPGRLIALPIPDLRRLIEGPLSAMGETYLRAGGPDGVEERAEAWITPQGMANRIMWALRVPERLLDRLPDPRDFVTHALGPLAPGEVIFAAEAAESRAEGVGVVLASAAFQWR